MKTSGSLVADLTGFFTNPDTWCKGACARDINGKPVSALSPNAVSFDLYGRIMRTNYDSNIVFSFFGYKELNGALRTLRDLLPNNLRNTDIEAFNDTLADRQAVLDFLGSLETPPIYVGDWHSMSYYYITPPSSQIYFTGDGENTIYHPVVGSVITWYNGGSNFTGTSPITEEHSILLDDVVVGTETYEIVAGDVGKEIRYEQIGTNALGSAPGYVYLEGVVVDPELFPNPISNFDVVVGGPGELIITIVAGDQVVGHPDTKYRIRYYTDDSVEIIYHDFSTPGTHTITGIPPGDYGVFFDSVHNDIGFTKPSSGGSPTYTVT